MLLPDVLGTFSLQALVSGHYELLVSLLTASALLVVYAAMGESSCGRGGFPIANPTRVFEFSSIFRVVAFIRSPRDLLRSFAERYRDTPYWLNMELGKVLVLPAHMINEIRVNPMMSSLAAIQEVQNGSLKGFEPIGDVLDDQMLKLVKEHLTTKNMGKMIPSISEEVSDSLSLIFSDSSDWKEFQLGEPIIRLVARTSSRVFGGKTFCRSEAWLKAMAKYTKHFLLASITLRFFPTWSKSLVQWILPPCWLLRSNLVNCRRVIEPILEQRQAEVERAQENGEDVEYAFDQALTSLDRDIDMATAHISLAMVAIHTTADLLEKTMLALIEHDELIEPLRQEVMSVLSTHGLSNAGLAGLTLMDSVLKETQRMNPVANSFLNRIALEDFQLSNGMIIPKGTLLGVGPTHMWDNSFYENGDKFDGYRFLRMREDPEKRQQSYLVSTSPHHLGFGHGSHACPGRFFAANEIKIILCHLLLKYEWKILGEGPHIINLGVLNAAYPWTKLQIRRRAETLNLDEILTGH
ncbi:Cytochrome P450 monooxygenase trt6 [Colletotrichum higginsianum]|uniref:Cytochrome P450 monooxygenase trt6 n=1 Tax=Colletotrichum higginsianum TaxID=80884 RepID=A0A4T0VDT5_9PEZI|nr:Cytochrome P450 monooxygenase trt6 [Colletotrichum higginsianum]